MQDKLTFLKSLRLFADVPDALLERIAAACEERHVARGETILRENERSDTAHLVMEGRVRSDPPGSASVFLESGEWLGESALLGGAATATARADTDVRLLSFRPQELARAGDDDSVVALATLTERLRGRVSARGPSDASGFSSFDTRARPSDRERRKGGSAAAPSPKRISHYAIVEELGYGGMGEVYAGFDETLERRVALKAIRADQRLSPDARLRFLREARILSQLDHPHICRIYDYLEEDDSDFLVLELIDGTNLRDAIREGIDERLKMKIAIQVAEVLVAAHAEGVVHRDLKPDNVMLTKEHDVKVLDFGLARSEARDSGEPEARAVLSRSRVDSRPDTSSQITELGHLVGTLRYMSPEQARGEPATPASDMFAFGLLLEEIETGRPPHHDAADRQDLLARVQGKAADGTSDGTELRADMGALVRRLKSSAPTHRPTAVETLSRLHFIRDTPTRRLRRAAVVAALTLLALFGIKYTVDLEHERTIAQARRDQAEALIGFMLGDLRQKLEPMGRLDILDDVGEQALDYFAAVSELELTEEELFRRSEALSQIGDVRIEQGQLDLAVAPLEESLRVARELVARDPDNGDWQLGLGAAHFWLGAVAMNRGRLDVALENWKAYLAIAEALVKKDADDLTYRSELAMAQGNVGDVLEAIGDLEGARESHEAALSTFVGIDALRSSAASRDDLASAHNKLARVRDRMGDLHGAHEHYEEEIAIRERLYEEDPENARTKLRWGTSRYFLGQVLEAMGETELAREHYRPAHEVMAELAASDPANTRWRRNLAETHLMLARIRRERGEEGAMESAEAAIQILDALVAAEPSQARWRANLAEAQTIRGRLLEQRGQIEGAMAQATAAIQAMERLLNDSPDDPFAPIELSGALVLEGRLREKLGDKDAARRSWQRAVSVISERARGSRDWRYLDPWVRALLHSGATEEASEVAAALVDAGYRNQDFIATCHRFGVLRSVPRTQ